MPPSGPPRRLDTAVEKEAGVGADITPGYAPEAVRRAFFGGTSEYWKPFLLAIAKRSGERVDWRTLCDEIGLSPKEASGMLGAAERRCKKQPPYDKVLEDGVYWFRMPSHVAKLVEEFSAE